MRDGPSEHFWEELGILNPDAVRFDGLDHCVLGLGGQFSMDPVLVYDYDLMIEHFLFNDNLTYEEAVEHVDLNVVGLWAGPHTPIIMRGA